MKDRKVAFVLATQHLRNVFDLLMEKYPDEDIYVVMTESVVSLRSSENDIDLSKIPTDI